MLKNKKFFWATVIIGVFAIAGLGGYVYVQKGGNVPFLALEHNEEEPSLNAPAPEPTGKINDVVSSLEKGLYEETSVSYGEDQDANLINGDLNSANEAANSNFEL